MGEGTIYYYSVCCERVDFDCILGVLLPLQCLASVFIARKRSLEMARRGNGESITLNQSRSVPGCVAEYLQLRHTNHARGDMVQHNTEALRYIRDMDGFPMRSF